MVSNLPAAKRNGPASPALALIVATLITMSLLNKLMKIAAVERVATEVRKPENQQKVKDLAASVQQKVQTWKASKRRDS